MRRFPIGIFLLSLVTAGHAQNGPGLYGGGYPGARYSGQQDMLADLLFNGGASTTGAGVAVLQTQPTITQPNILKYFSVDGNLFGVHATNYHLIKNPDGTDSIQIGNTVDPVNYYKNGTHRFTGANGVAAYADIFPGGLRLYNNTAPTVRFGTSGAVDGILNSGFADGSRLRLQANTQDVLILAQAASSVNYWNLTSSPAGAGPTAVVGGADTNINMSWSSKGTGAIDWYTNSFNNRQVSFTHTASANRYLTLTGSNGGNPTIGASAGGVAISAPLVLSQATLLRTSVALTNGAGASAGSLTNAPAAGNPTKWIPISDNGTTRYIPAW